MCIAFPGKIISIDAENFALIDIGGTRREVSLDLIDQDVTVGDYVIAHAGYALHKVDEEQAKQDLAFLQELIENEIY